MHRVHLTPEEAAELHRRTRAADIKPRTRDRLEMVRLCAAGYRVPEIARLLRVGPQCVRCWLRRYRQGGFEALADRQLDVCVLISSLSSVLGGLGFTSYAAANAFLRPRSGTGRSATRARSTGLPRSATRSFSAT